MRSTRVCVLRVIGVQRRDSEVECEVMAHYTSVPICDECWRSADFEREPVRFKEPSEEKCFRCGKLTHSGIYVREQVE